MEILDNTITIKELEEKIEAINKEKNEMKDEINTLKEENKKLKELINKH